MDRRTVYAGAVPLETDLLYTNRFAMVALGFLAQDLLGSGTLVAGAVCGPTSPASLSVAITPGRIYSLQSLEATNWSSLTADTTHQIVKQGIAIDTTTLGCAPPTNSGQSINYLIEAQYQDVDSGNVVLGYYNATNPSQPYSGAGGNATSQPTVRGGRMVFQAVAGTAATTGTQTTPAATSGWTALYVVTVAYGQTTITSGNITQVSGAPFCSPLTASSGTFVGTAGGFGSTITVTCRYKITNSVVNLLVPPVNGTSNATTFTLSGLPSQIQTPSSFGTMAIECAGPTMIDNGNVFAGGTGVISPNSGVILFTKSGGASGWTTSGNKGFASAMSLSYPIA